jgi:hypothetical protein
MEFLGEHSRVFVLCRLASTKHDFAPRHVILTCEQAPRQRHGSAISHFTSSPDNNIQTYLSQRRYITPPCEVTLNRERRSKSLLQYIDTSPISIAFAMLRTANRNLFAQRMQNNPEPGIRGHRDPSFNQRTKTLTAWCFPGCLTFGFNDTLRRRK